MRQTQLSRETGMMKATSTGTAETIEIELGGGINACL
jgi:hypothetical protein